MDIISINKDNLANEHICCALGNDKRNKIAAQTKKNWLKERFDDGLVFKRLNDRGKVFIEYMPIETAWKPILGKNFMIINCLWISGKFKGQGLSTKLLEEAISDSKKRKMDGLAVISSKKVKPFLTDKRLYLKNGFEVVDTAEDYFELLVLKFNKKAENPRFSDHLKKSKRETDEGFKFIYSNQCPFMEEYVGILEAVSKKRGFTYRTIKLESSADAKSLGSPFGTFGLYYNGEFKTHELMPEKKFNKFIDGLVNI